MKEILKKWPTRIAKTNAILAILIPLIVIICYFYTINRYSINFPFYDDFHAVLQFIINYNNETSWQEKLQLLTSQHNEHKIIFNKITVLLNSTFSQTINFKTLILIGNFSLLLTFGVLYLSALRSKEIKLFYLIPISLLMFNFRYYEVSFWAMASLQNMWVITFALLSLYLLFEENKTSLFLSIFFAFAATYTSGNGLMTFVAGAFVLFLNKKIFEYKTFFWILSGVLAFYLYFHNYSSPAHHPSVYNTLIHHPLNFIGYILNFIGGGFKPLPLGITIGGILIIFTLIITLKKYFRTNATIYSIIVFFILTALITAIGRAGFGIDQSGASRYIINSSVFMATSYITFISIYSKYLKTHHYIFFIAISAFLHIYTYTSSLPIQINYKREFDYNYTAIKEGINSNFNFGWPIPDKTEPIRILANSYNEKIFDFNYQEKAINLNQYVIFNERKQQHNIDNFDILTNEIKINGWAFLNYTSSDKTIKIISIRDSIGNDIIYIPTSVGRRGDVTKHFAADNTDYEMSGFDAKFNTKNLVPGKYNLILILIENKKRTEIDIKKHFVI